MTIFDYIFSESLQYLAHQDVTVRVGIAHIPRFCYFITSLTTEVRSAHLSHLPYKIMSSQEKQGIVTGMVMATSGKLF